MSSTLQALEAAALLLLSGQRARLAERLIASLDRDPEVETAWAEEIKRRIADLEAGLVDTIPAEQALEQARAQ